MPDHPHTHAVMRARTNSEPIRKAGVRMSDFSNPYNRIVAIGKIIKLIEMWKEKHLSFAPIPVGKQLEIYSKGLAAYAEHIRQQYIYDKEPVITKEVKRDAELLAIRSKAIEHFVEKGQYDQALERLVPVHKELLTTLNRRPERRYVPILGRAVSLLHKLKVAKNTPENEHKQYNEILDSKERGLLKFAQAIYQGHCNEKNRIAPSYQAFVDIMEVRQYDLLINMYQQASKEMLQSRYKGECRERAATI